MFDSITSSASLLPIQTLQNDFVDIVVIGEGEDTLGEVADATIKQNGLKKVNGIGYKKNGLVKLTKSRRWLELDKYAPAWDLIDARRYFTRLGSKRRAFSIVTSRGCPHQCTFCYNVAFNRMTWRAHSTSYVVSQISMLKKKLGIDAIYFQDDNFFTDKQRAYKILEKIKLPWYAEVRADYLTRKDVEKMEQLNCQRLLIGAESGSPRILKEIVKKDLKKEEIVRAVKLCKNKIPVSLSFIVGYPTESMEELGETMECVEQLLRIEAENVIDVNVLAPYPGTEIYNLLPDEFKPKSTEEWQYLTRKVISLPWLNQEQRKMINGMLIAAHYFHPGYSKTRANRLIQRMLRFRWRYKFFDFFLEPELIRLKENLFKWRVKQQKKIA